MGITLTGLNRDRYAETHAMRDPRPMRFDGTDAYSEWAIRADAWALRTAARVSIILPVDPQSGQRKDDPLEVLIPGKGPAMPNMIRAVEYITGERPYDDEGRPNTETGIVNVAPWLRATLRRWAMKHEQ